MRPAVARLAVNLPVGVGDMGGVEDAVLLLALIHFWAIIANKGRVDGTVDDRMSDMHALWTEFAGHALGRGA